MQAAVKLASSSDELAPILAPETQLELLPNCALRSALWALTHRSTAESDHEAIGKSNTPDATGDLYSLMKRCAFFNRTDCHCECHASAPSINTRVRVIYQTRQQL